MSLMSYHCLPFFVLMIADISKVLTSVFTLIPPKTYRKFLNTFTLTAILIIVELRSCSRLYSQLLSINFTQFVGCYCFRLHGTVIMWMYTKMAVRLILDHTITVEDTIWDKYVFSNMLFRKIHVYVLCICFISCMFTSFEHKCVHISSHCCIIHQDNAQNDRVLWGWCYEWGNHHCPGEN